MAGRACDREIDRRTQEEAKMMIDMSEEIIRLCKDYMLTDHLRAKMILGFSHLRANGI